MNLADHSLGTTKQRRTLLLKQSTATGSAKNDERKL
jgi:hypothetical protein